MYYTYTYQMHGSGEYIYFPPNFSPLSKFREKCMIFIPLFSRRHNLGLLPVKTVSHITYTVLAGT